MHQLTYCTQLGAAKPREQQPKGQSGGARGLTPAAAWALIPDLVGTVTARVPCGAQSTAASGTLGHLGAVAMSCSTA